jgi:hypothetical protein
MDGRRVECVEKREEEEEKKDGKFGFSPPAAPSTDRCHRQSLLGVFAPGVLILGRRANPKRRQAEFCVTVAQVEPEIDPSSSASANMQSIPSSNITFKHLVADHLCPPKRLVAKSSRQPTGKIGSRCPAKHLGNYKHFILISVITSGKWIPKILLSKHIFPPTSLSMQN